MTDQWYESRKEICVVKERMGGYRKRDKLNGIAARSSTGAKVLKAKLPEMTAPKALVLEIYYPEYDYEYPIENYFPTDPCVILKEVCVETGKVFNEFRLSLEEAQAIGILLKEKLAK